MDRSIALTVDRVARSRAARDARETDRVVSSSAATTTRTRALSTGARVFDLVTGQEGEIVGRTTENILVPAPDQRNG